MVAGGVTGMGHSPTRPGDLDSKLRSCEWRSVVAAARPGSESRAECPRVGGLCLRWPRAVIGSELTCPGRSCRSSCPRSVAVLCAA